uniref:Uncharacterized protein n=1 Tax=Rhizophora mucronata TaxID=61149 RepID=A0A2P2IQD1_RHIMU
MVALNLVARSFVPASPSSALIKFICGEVDVEAPAA